MDNIIDSIKTIRTIFNKIEKIINSYADDICEGRASYETYTSLGNSMETVANMVGGETASDDWKEFYGILKKGQYTSNTAVLLSSWIEFTDASISNIEKRIGYCPICRNEVVYLEDNGYYRKMQKEHGFKYWYGSFETIGKEKRKCPVCGSMDRDRLMTMFISLLGSTDGTKLKVLQIAPSGAMETWLRGRDNIVYESTDLYMPRVSFNADIQDLKMVSDNTYDIILCSHILEHVENDKKAMREIRRVLKKDGLCIFLVPILGGLSSTDEEFECSEHEKWLRFGQDDHVRLYGKEDFLDRLSEVGFNVYTIGQDFFDPEEWKHAGLISNSCLYVAAKNTLDIGVKPYKRSIFEEELVSVIIPTHNRARCIKESIDSVLKQTYYNLELIVVDDFSIDNTEEIVRGIADERVRYIRLNENKGANAARNIGIQSAKGNYIAFNDSDDCWHEDKLYKQMRYLKLLERTEQSEIGAVYCGFERIRGGESLGMIPDFLSQGEHIIGDIYEYMQSHMFLSTQTLLFKKSILEDVGYFNESLKRLQDWELMLRVAKKYKIMPIQEILVDVRISSDALSNNDAAWWDTLKYVFVLHDFIDNNYPAYMSLVLGTAYMLGHNNVSEGIKEDFYDFVIAEGAVSKIHEKALGKILFGI